MSFVYDARSTDFGRGRSIHLLRSEGELLCSCIALRVGPSNALLWRSDLSIPPAFPARWFDIVPMRTTRTRRRCARRKNWVPRFLRLAWCLPTRGRSTGFRGGSDIQTCKTSSALRAVVTIFFFVHVTSFFRLLAPCKRVLAVGLIGTRLGGAAPQVVSSMKNLFLLACCVRRPCRTDAEQSWLAGGADASGNQREWLDR